MTYIKMRDIKKTYQVGDVVIKAVDGIDLDIEQGQFVAIVGPSGAGKTTIMNILGGMDLPTSGEVLIDNKDISILKDKQMTQYRRDDVGFVFQSYNLIPNLTAIENVELATQISKDAKDPATILGQVGLENRLHNFPAQLSGGEQQRVAIARAIAKNPKLLLCDEPTGALDTETGTQILQVLKDCSDIYGMTVILITHNSEIAKIANHVIEVKNGEVSKDWINTDMKSVTEIKW